MRESEPCNMKLFQLLSKYADMVIAVSIMVGGIMWLTAIADSVSEVTKANAAQEIEIKHQMSLLTDIRERLIRIETKLER